MATFTCFAAPDQCSTCHDQESTWWNGAAHAHTQMDVATELAAERAGQTPEAVLHGAEAEDCLACHAPRAILANGGMSETAALSYFFTTSNGQFTAETTAAHQSDWPHVTCTSCHELADPHLGSPIPAQLALFDSRTGAYTAMNKASELCGQCHGSLRFPDTDHLRYDLWVASPHNDTQTDVAVELGEERAGQTPDEVIHGPDAEHCIACHAPTAVQATDGDEAAALSYFFTTSNGQFTANTASAHADEWPGVTCTTCHNPHDPGLPAFYNAATQEYAAMTNAAQLCGQCHGSLQFPDTDHQLYDAWAGSAHNATQTDVAAELGEARAGQTPGEVIHGPDAEHCIACHAPTAVQVTDGDEAAALSYFFTTSNGQFTANTAPAHADEWPGVTCTVCHNPHDSGTLAFYDSATQEYAAMTNSAQLCGQCHGNLRFPDTDHRSFNVLTGAGAAGVPDQQTMPGVTCTDCHMYGSDVDESSSKMFHGHRWAITVAEAGGTSTTSCTHCHEDLDTLGAHTLIDSWQAEFAALDATASASVAQAAAALQGVQNPAQQAMLAEAQQNLSFAESDESGGFHNHHYLMALLQAANEKARSLSSLRAARQGADVVISWTGPGILQSAPSPTGPWQNVEGATNPLVLPQNAHPAQQFYRLRIAP